MSAPTVTHDNVVALHQRTANPRALVPTARDLIERLAADEDNADLRTALVDLAVLAYSSRNQILPTGLMERLADITEDAQRLLADLTCIDERDTQRAYLGDNLAAPRWHADNTVATEAAIQCDLDDLASYWLGLS